MFFIVERVRKRASIDEEILRVLSTCKEIPPPAESDSVDLFCRSMADILRMLDIKTRLSAQIELMQLLRDKF